MKMILMILRKRSVRIHPQRYTGTNAYSCSGVGEVLATLVQRERAERRRLVTFVPPAHVCVSTPVKTFCQTSPAWAEAGDLDAAGSDTLVQDGRH
jgi:hypothetical protein